jgi:hypothetical protein
MLVSTFVMTFASLQAPAAFAQEQQRDPNEGEPKHEINELQNRLHQTDDPSKENHLEGTIDALQEERQEARLTNTECLLAHIFTVGLFPLIEKGATSWSCIEDSIHGSRF